MEVVRKTVPSGGSGVTKAAFSEVGSAPRLGVGGGIGLLHHIIITCSCLLSVVVQLMTMTTMMRIKGGQSTAAAAASTSLLFIVSSIIATLSYADKPCKYTRH